MKGKILHVSDLDLFLSRGSKIFSSKDAGATWSLFSVLPTSFIERLARISIFARLFRLGVHHFIPCDDGYFVIYNKNIIKLDNNGSLLHEPVRLIGGRPLNVAVIDNNLWYGEYRSNPDRQTVGIYSFNGRAQRREYSLANVRHIHGVFKDPYSSAIYITTGDSDSEAGIWRLSEKGLNLVVGGSQQYRAVQLLFTADHIYFGTDTPLEKNFIYKIHKVSLVLTLESPVSSSIFYGTKVQDTLFFATVVEPSEVNLAQSSELWIKYEDRWVCMKKFKRDRLPLKFFQYAQIIFPSYSSYSQPYLWFYKQGVLGSGYSERIMIRPLINDFKTNKVARINK